MCQFVNEILPTKQMAYIFKGEHYNQKKISYMKKLMALFIVSIIATSVYAQKPAVMMSSKPGWHKIGEVTADFKKEKDEIIVLGADRFKSILLKVTDAPVSISDLTVYFEN